MHRRLLAATLSLALGLGLSAATLATAPAASAVLDTPRDLAPDGETVGANPVLSWTHVRGATGYEVQAAASNDFGTTLWSTETENRQLVPTKALPSGDLFWRVRAESSSEQSAWSTAFFTVDEGAAPVLKTPLDGEELTQPAEAPQLTWEPVQGATGYEVEIDDDASFTGAPRYTTKTTSLSYGTPPAAGERWWRVRAIRNGGQATDWSTPRSYLITPIPQPGLVSPGSSPETVLSDVVLDWTAVAGATRYEYRVSTDRDFSPGTVTSGYTVATRWSPPTTFNNDQYWWQVRAYDGNGNTAAWPDPDSSRTWQFQRAWQFGTGPAAPSLVYPLADAAPVEQPLRFEWDPVRLASRYALEVGTDPNFSPGTYSRCLTQATTYVPSLDSTEDACRVGAARIHYWRVQALDGPRNVNSVFSEIRRFTYRSGVFTPTSPAEGATVSVPSVSWEPYQGAEQYKVTMLVAGEVHVAFTHSTSYTLPERPDAQLPTTVTWHVQAQMANGQLNAAPVSSQTFRLVAGTGATASTPTPQAPALDSQHQRFPELRWSPVAGADAYEVFVGTVGSTGVSAIQERFEYPAGTDTTATWIRPGHYFWFVRALDAENFVIATGPRSQFHVDPMPGVVGESVALRGRDLGSASTRCDDSIADTTGNGLCEQLRQTPVLDWDPVRGASRYMVYVARDENLTNLVWNPETQAKATTQQTMWTPTTLLPDSQAGQAYYWVVRPCRTAGVCAPDPTKATHAFDKQSAPVQGLTATQPVAAPPGPTGDPSTGDVTFSWEDYLVTNQSPANAGGTGRPATIEASQYRVQVSTSSSFQAETVLDSATVDQSTYTSASEAYPDRELWWRVSAIDASGNVLASATRTFVKQSTPPDLLAPVDRDETAHTPALRWTARPWAKEYQVEVYKNDDGNFSTGNRVLAATTKMSVYSPSEPLPASDLAYVWRVRTVNPSGGPGPWSQGRRFVVRGTAPVPTGPAVGANVPATSALFTWQPVSGAALYRFELRAAGSTSISEGVTTAALGYAPFERLDDRRWEWRVLTMDALGKPVAASSWQEFVVDSTAPQVTRSMPEGTGKPTTKPSATFSEPVRGVTTASMKLFKKGKQHPVSADVGYDAAKRKAVLDPAKDLTRGQYRVVLGKQIADAAGNKLAKTEWTFRVGG